MFQATLLPELIMLAAQQRPQAVALSQGDTHWTYAALNDAVNAVAAGFLQLGVARADRVGIYLEKRFEAVVASFAAPLAGAVFVPINPLLKAEQVAHILRDCNVRVLVTSPERMALLEPVLSGCPDLQHLVLCAPTAALYRNPRHSCIGQQAIGKRWFAALRGAGTASLTPTWRPSFTPQAAPGNPRG